MKKKPIEQIADREFYFTARFKCPTCGGIMAAYDFGRAWSADGLSNDHRHPCQHCGQEIDWSSVPFPRKVGERHV